MKAFFSAISHCRAGSFSRLGRSALARARTDSVRAVSARFISSSRPSLVDWTVGDDLSYKKCDPCEQGGKPLARDETERLQGEVPEWRIAEDNGSISRKWVCSSFKEAFEFAERIAVLAENEGHHPDIHITAYRNVKIVLWTHFLRGLSYNDFLLAMKIDFLQQPELMEKPSARRKKAEGN
mmetsp:Transcript_22773/g.57993  ORF Transcript_22773/g.57993 Transcript_22773/m.57993 type:complete len:181 (-) Transcript_22773:513-1055(-)|eukprot:CAMPEP_0113869730 /NCGR_PEP_ID=MMETSP0780_2-20120614/1697_1 /TAXON_ID=652834 /ORGANISM="Palpitomonas bilix" /LENGTH=180 /DNA_ID=CAMNT_0000854937 /DNA_START=108 /DNA_END=650 /DNA_ORIENTATION=+ /assembly_acc=CAM_ASM_000599